MATRFKISTYPHVLDLPRHASWSGGGANPSVQLVFSDDAVSNTTALVNVNESASSAVGDYHVVTGLSKPLAAQTISGTVKGQIKARSNAAAADYMSQLLIRVLSSTGVHKAVLLPLHASALANEWNSVGVMNAFMPYVPNTALTPYSCAEGDILAFEFGFRSLNLTAAIYTGSLQLGGVTNTADLPEDQTSVLTTLPWVELSQDLVFGSPPSGTVSGALPVIGVEYLPEPPAVVGGVPDGTMTGQLWPRGF